MALRSFWSSRMPIRHFIWQTADTSLRPDAFDYRTPASISWPTQRYRTPIWAVRNVRCSVNDRFLRRVRAQLSTIYQRIRLAFIRTRLYLFRTVWLRTESGVDAVEVGRPPAPLRIATKNDNQGAEHEEIDRRCHSSGCIQHGVRPAGLWCWRHDLERPVRYCPARSG